MARFRKTRPKLGKGVQKSDSIVFNVGAATAPSQHVILQTGGGARSTTGAVKGIQDNADTGDICNVGDVVKYVNIMAQGATKAPGAVTVEDVGWIEWALVMVKESENVIPITLLGTKSLMDVANQMYRNECIYTGFFPVGGAQPNGVTMSFKVPRFKQSITLGDEWSMYYSYRDVIATSVGTNDVRIVSTAIYKTHS